MLIEVVVVAVGVAIVDPVAEVVMMLVEIVEICY